MAKKQDGGWDDPANEVQSNWMKFNVSATDAPMGADKIHGTLIKKYQQKSQMAGREGEMQNVYEIKADEETTFHALDEKKKLIEEAITINPGDIYNIGGTATIDRQMRNIKVGQIIGLKYIEEVPAKTKGYNPAKVVKVYVNKNAEGTAPLMDEEFLQENAVDEFGDSVNSK